MMLLEHPQYQRRLSEVGELPLPWEKLKNSTIAMSGATGMVGRFLIDVIMYRNRVHNQNCVVYSLGRTERKAKQCFSEYWDHPLFHFLQWDFRDIPAFHDTATIDYIFHLASTTHPKAYATEPIDTIMVNIIGLHHLLEAACFHATKRFVFTSSCEIYGNALDDTMDFTEDSCGYINCNTLRAGYPESKRAGEALCQAYLHEYGLDIVIPRLSRLFGPTMHSSDTKAISQFIQKGIEKEDIVLKSKGTQVYSYTYIADAVSGILTCLFSGKCGSAYNIAANSIAMKDLAHTIAEYVGKKVVFELPDKVEQTGYSQATRSVLNTELLQQLGWKPQCDLKSGLAETIEILSLCRNLI